MSRASSESTGAALLGRPLLFADLFSAEDGFLFGQRQALGVGNDLLEGGIQFRAG